MIVCRASDPTRKRADLHSGGDTRRAFTLGPRTELFLLSLIVLFSLQVYVIVTFFLPCLFIYFDIVVLLYFPPLPLFLFLLARNPFIIFNSKHVIRRECLRPLTARSASRKDALLLERPHSWHT